MFVDKRIRALYKLLRLFQHAVIRELVATDRCHLVAGVTLDWTGCSDALDQMSNTMRSVDSPFVPFYGLRLYVFCHLYGVAKEHFHDLAKVPEGLYTYHIHIME